MNKISLFSVLPMWLFFLSECFLAQNNEPEELYVKASQLMQDVIAGVETSTGAFQSYKIAQQAIRRIMSEFTSSTVAAGLLSGQARMSGFTPAEFQELEQPLKRLAESEQGRLAYAPALAETARHIPNPSSHRFIQKPHSKISTM